VKKICMAIVLLYSQSILANVETYQNTENTGLNKLERIDGIEKYLVNLSATLKNMENKLKDQGDRLDQVVQEVKTLKDNEAKRITAALGQKSNDPNALTGEIEKLRADYTTLKNDDIERLSKDILQLKEKLKDIQYQSR